MFSKKNLMGMFLISILDLGSGDPGSDQQFHVACSGSYFTTRQGVFSLVGMENGSNGICSNLSLCFLFCFNFLNVF